MTWIPGARRAGALLFTAAISGAGVGTPARAQEVLLSRAEALHEIFPEAAREARETRALSDADRAALHRALGRPVAERSVEVSRVLDGAGTLLGYAVVTEEVGKYQPITFMVGVTPTLSVRGVEVMVYRESRGGDVKRQRFLSQYRGKTTADPIDANRDIVNIAGATISVRAMNAGVRRVLAELALLYPAAPGPRP